jgi:hypothetical protein
LQKAVSAPATRLEAQRLQGGGTGGAGVAAEIVQCDISIKTAKLFVRHTKCLNMEG